MDDVISFHSFIVLCTCMKNEMNPNENNNALFISKWEHLAAFVEEVKFFTLSKCSLFFARVNNLTFGDNNTTYYMYEKTNKSAM